MEHERYTKINTVYKRDDKGKIIDGEYSLDIFKYLENNLWYVTEKIDGTNIQIRWDAIEKTVEFGGKDENAQIPSTLVNKLIKMFTIEMFNELYPDISMIIYGEGYGVGIQKGGKYIKDDVNFIMFDVTIGGLYLKIANALNISEKLNIQFVPILSPMTLINAINIIREGGFNSLLKVDNEFIAEGFVLRPLVRLFDREGKLIIVKIKVKDFIV